MECTKVETTIIEEEEVTVERADLLELNQLQLALIGGGIGDVVWG